MTPEERATAEGMLFTDMYQLTMAQLYFSAGMHERHAQFDYFFRSYPDYGQHQAGFCVNAGLEWLVDWIRGVRFRAEDLQHLRAQKGRGGRPLFSQAFIDWLAAAGTFEGITMRAVPEGRVVHPNVPIVVVQGPLAMAQLLETACLNHMNYQTLVATKAARVREAARGGTILEFGMRRAHDKAANAGARAALIGGADFSSNTGMSYVLGFPPKGTHAHSMVQAYMALGEGELGAFRTYAEVFPDDCLLLVDTIDTLESGIPNAIAVFEELRRKGHEPVGIRLDSGDLAYLSIQAARMLDAAGFPEVSIVLSNQLDELVIWQILTQIAAEAPRYGVDADRLIGRLVYGVGTRLITSRGASALDGVYKLVALRNGGAWTPAIKLSESPTKTLNPGYKHAWRVYDRRGNATVDVLSLEDEEVEGWDRLRLHHPIKEGVSRTLRRSQISSVEALHADILREGRVVCDFPDVQELRRRREADVNRLDAGVKRLMNPHIYHVSLTDALWRFKRELVKSLRDTR
jgi:nicotinate phosphoribosyltransferase